jgi:hypothetical protein
MTEKRLTDALELFALSQPFTREQLDQKREALLHTWTPRRFANLTNNPKKYMQAYTKAEEMTRLVEASYALLSGVSRSRRRPPSLVKRLGENLARNSSYVSREMLHVMSQRGQQGRVTRPQVSTLKGTSGAR